MPPHARRIVGASRLFTVPVEAMAEPHAVTIALRIWQEPNVSAFAVAGPRGKSYAGDSVAMTERFEQQKRDDLFRLGGQYTLYVIEVLAGLASLLLYLLRRRENTYLWFGVNCLIPANFLPWLLLAQQGTALLWAVTMFNLLSFASNLTGALFFLSFVKVRARSWLSLFILSSLLITAGFVLYNGVRPAPGFVLLSWIGDTAYCAGAITLMAQAWKAGKPDARLMFWPVMLNTILVWFSVTDWLLHAFGMHLLVALDFTTVVLVSRPFPITLDDITNLIWYTGISGVLVYRFARISREEERLTVSLDAARDVQHRLVPANLPALPGFHAEVAYISAEEVGGDFFQVLPQSEDALLVVIGDVSGKGLQAAMLGTLAVGAIRTLAQEEIEPAELLSRLNDQLVAATDNSFITCLCARISEDGELTVANAGHLSPYVNGEELQCPSDLPLGIVSGVVYEQNRALLMPNARVTFLSDGVTEARSKDGELFGFERARHSSRMSAAEIADAAQRFGQEDDITVLTLDWSGAAVAHATRSGL